jgi:hypothetical protein
MHGVIHLTNYNKFHRTEIRDKRQIKKEAPRRNIRDKLSSFYEDYKSLHAKGF